MRESALRLRWYLSFFVSFSALIMPPRGRLEEQAWVWCSSNKLSKRTVVRSGLRVHREKAVPSPSPCQPHQHKAQGGAYCNTPLLGLQVFHNNSNTFSDGRASTACCPFTIMGRCSNTGCCNNRSITASRVT